MEEVIEILRRKALKHGKTIAEEIVNDLRDDLERVHAQHPAFARKFVESIPSSFLRRLDNIEMLKKLLRTSSIVLEAHREPVREMTEVLLELILAANRRCHTSTKYHTTHLIEGIGSKVGLFEVARKVQELGKPSRSNVYRIVRAALLYAHPELEFTGEEALKNHNVAGLVYLVGYPEFKREWIEVLRKGGDVHLDKDITGSIQVGNKLVLLSSSLRRILEAYDRHQSCISPHLERTGFFAVLHNRFLIPILVIGKRSGVIARINGYYINGKLIIGSKVYGSLTRKEAVNIFNQIKKLGVEVYVPVEYLEKAKEGRMFALKLSKRPEFPISDDYVDLVEEGLYTSAMVKL